MAGAREEAEEVIEEMEKHGPRPHPKEQKSGEVVDNAGEKFAGVRKN